MLIRDTGTDCCSISFTWRMFGKKVPHWFLGRIMRIISVPFSVFVFCWRWPPFDGRPRNATVGAFVCGNVLGVSFEFLGVQRMAFPFYRYSIFVLLSGQILTIFLAPNRSPTCVLISHSFFSVLCFIGESFVDEFFWLVFEEILCQPGICSMRPFGLSLEYILFWILLMVSVPTEFFDKYDSWISIWTSI